MTCRQLHNLISPPGKERVGGNKNRFCMQLQNCCESGIDLAFVAGIDYAYLPSDRASCRLHFADIGPDIWKARVHEKSYGRGRGHQVMQQPQAFGPELSAEYVHSGRVTARPPEVSDQPDLDRITADGEDDWNRRCGGVRRDRSRGPLLP